MTCCRGARGVPVEPDAMDDGFWGVDCTCDTARLTISAFAFTGDGNGEIEMAVTDAECA